MGFAHNNCGGFCCRAGQGHFAKLLEEMPERYLYHEQKEQEMREFLGRDVSMLKRTRRVTEDVYYIPTQEYDEVNEEYVNVNLKSTPEEDKEGKGYWTQEKVTKTYTLTLKQLREELEAKKTDEIDFQDIGGCGCFVTDDQE